MTPAVRTAAAIDWPALHRRLSAAEREAQGTDLVAGSPAARALLDERARVLARPLVTAPVGRIEVLVFALAGERYGIESRFVQAVFVLRDRAPLPGAQPPIHGVTAWRGELLTLLELRATFGLPVSSLNDLARVVVVGQGPATFGILTDAVYSIVPLDLASLHPLPAGNGEHRRFLLGVTGDALQVLDPKQLLRLTEPDSPRVE